jgi:hypothetical protein
MTQEHDDLKHDLLLYGVHIQKLDESGTTRIDPKDFYEMTQEHDYKSALGAALRYVEGEDIPWVDFHGHVDVLLTAILHAANTPAQKRESEEKPWEKQDES